MIERLFGVRAAGSTPGREALGGLTTFLTMAYIVVVNPAILTQAGLPLEGAILATCAAAGLASLGMGLWANLPIALAPGMGLNAFFAFGICLGAGVPWPTGLGIVFWAGVLFLILSVTGVRRRLVAAIPKSLRLAGAVGIGLFIAFLGLQQGGLVAADPNTLVTLGDLHSPAALLTLVGLAVGLALTAAGVRAAIFLALAASLGLGLAFGLVPWPETLLSLPSEGFPGFSIDLWGALAPQHLGLIAALLFFDLFDTLGTLLAVGHEAGLLEDGELPRLERALAVDSAGSVAGSLFGTSTVTSYIESGAGVGVGARTGLASVVTGGLFLLAPLATPLVAVVGQGLGDGLYPVTAPALILVGALMIRAVAEIDWRDPVAALPAFLTAAVMPLTFSITHGLAAGFVTHVLALLATGRPRDIHPILAVLALLIVASYIWLPV